MSCRPEPILVHPDLSHLEFAIGTLISRTDVSPPAKVSWKMERPFGSKALCCVVQLDESRGVKGAKRQVISVQSEPGRRAYIIGQPAHSIPEGAVARPVLAIPIRTVLS